LSRNFLSNLIFLSTLPIFSLINRPQNGMAQLKI
jgi:hypothetical protein